MLTQPLPEPEDVRSLLNGLLGRDVTVARVHPESLGIDAKVVIAVYLRDDDKIGGLCVADISVAAYAGAALSLLPKGVAEENIEDGVIGDNLLENFHEVLNVGSAWFTAKASPHVSLTQVYSPGERPPAEVAVVMGGPADRLDLEVDVAGYGKGRLRLLATSWA